MKKLNKKNILELTGILFTTLFLCSNFLQMHFSSDTYVLMDLGYFRYPSEYFLPDGRLFSALACYIGGFLKLPYPVYIISMDFIGMIFLSISIYIFSKVLCDILKPQNLLFEIIIIIASHFLILNQYSLEYLLFPESAVMCMGFFFSILAIKILAKKTKFKYFKIWLCLLITGISYQGELNIFPILAILIYILKQIKENKKNRTFLKKLFIEILKLVVLITSILVITILIVKLGRSMPSYTTSFQDKKQLIVKIINERTFWLRFRTVKKYINEHWNYCIYMLPKYSLNIAIILTLIFLIITKAKIQTYIYYISLVALAFISSILPLFIFNVGVFGRISVPLMMIFGISALILIANSLCNKKSYQINIAIIFTLAIFLINGIFIIQNTSEHIAANRVDQNTGATIKHLIEKYEKENNITVTKLGYKYDFEPQQFAIGIKPMQSMTERKFACGWSILYAMNYYCDKKFEKVEYIEPDYDDHFFNTSITNYEEFSEEQIYFKDDTIYMVVY